MKKKCFLAACLSTFMTISSVVTPFLSIPVSASGNLNSFTENGTSDIPISCEVKSGYKVILPAQIALEKTTTKYEKTFQAGVIGNIDYDKFVIVQPKNNSYTLTDQAGQRSVNADVTQNDVSWSANELGLGESVIEKDASTEAELTLAGSYSGEMQYEFYLSSNDVSSGKEEGLQLSVSGTEVNEGESINVAMDSEMKIKATMNGEEVDNSQIEYESTNEHITVNEDGDIIISNQALPGESSTITATVNNETAKASNVFKYLEKTGILTNVCAAPKTSISFDVKIFDIHMDVNNISDVRILTVHPGDKITIDANITPADNDVDILWTKTVIGGGLTKLTNNSARLVVPEDIEIGSSFEVLANIGSYAKPIKIMVAHGYTESITPATCTDDGLITKTCSCGKVELETIPATGHKSVSANNAIVATCTTEGKESDTKCSVCGITLTTGQSIPVTGHTYGEYTVTKAATCTEDGSKERTCSVCNNVDTAVVTKLGHDYASTFTVDKAATCTETGSKSKHCSRCDSKSEITSIPALGHSYGSVTYNWSDDKSTCTASRTCSTCSHVDTETVNTTNKVTTAATCTETGVRTYTATFTNSAFKTQTTTVAVLAAGHKSVSSNNAISATCTTAGKESDTKCSVCGVTLTIGKSIPALGHSYGEYTVTKAATCTEDGAKARTCSVCNYVDTAVVTKLGHNYASTFTVDKAATCTEAGSKSKHCSRCDSKSEITSIPVTDHAYGSATYNWSDDKSTCTASRTCSTCSHVDTETVNTTNEVTTAATCTEAGVRIYTATFTNSAFKTQTTTVAVLAAGHKSVSANNAIAATCTTAGKESDTKCSVCGVTLTTGKSIPALGHSYGEYTITKAATCTEDGSKEHICSTCGNIETIAIPALGHDYADTFTIDKEATCLETGIKSKHCSRCDSKTEICDIPLSDHNYINGVCSVCNEKKEYVAGLYDANDNLLCTWEESRIYVGTNYTYSTYETSTTSPYYVIKNKYPKTTKVVIPDGITRIGNYAFYNCQNTKTCSGLTNIIIPDSVTSIGNNAFYGCTSLTSIIIPDKVTSIGEYAFYDCSSLANITIPDSITSIGNGVFSFCRSLTSITIPDGVTSIGNVAFSGCSGLTSITIPDGVTNIGNYVFQNCIGLTSITIPNSVTSIGDGVFRGCTGLTSIPDNVISIGKEAFRDCTGLTSITIPDNITSIGEQAFYNCSNLTSIIISDSVTSIEYLAFSDCTGLTSITIPDSVTSIGNNSFYNCSNLTSITIPNSVTNIGGGAFGYCTGLISVTIPDSVTSIGNGAFGYCSNLTSITIPDSITSIGNYIFQYCTGLTSITIPDNITSIGNYAFRNCTSLTGIIIPDSVTSIGNYAFQNCSKITSITIPDGVTSIGQYAFQNCLLTNVTFKRTSGWYVGTSAGAKTTALSSSNLANTSTAATYLKSKYGGYSDKYWTR